MIIFTPRHSGGPFASEWNCSPSACWLPQWLPPHLAPSAPLLLHLDECPPCLQPSLLGWPTRLRPSLTFSSAFAPPVGPWRAEALTCKAQAGAHLLEDGCSYCEPDMVSLGYESKQPQGFRSCSSFTLAAVKIVHFNVVQVSYLVVSLQLLLNFWGNNCFFLF